MKRFGMGVTVLLLASACASSSMPVNAIEGGPGQDITVGIAGIEEDGALLDQQGSRAYVVSFEVTNLADFPIAVTKIGVMPPSGGSQAMRFGSRTVNVNEMIDPGEDHIFDIRLEGNFVRPFRRDESRLVEFRLLVGLSNEQTYFYSFEVPVREDFPRRF